MRPSSSLNSIHLLSTKIRQYPLSGLGKTFSHILSRTKSPCVFKSPYFVDPSIVIENIAVLSKKSDKTVRLPGKDVIIFFF